MITSLSIIFPVFNEELRLKSSFNHIKNFLRKKKKFKTEIIFVDDGSKDNSYNLIEKYIKETKKNKKINIKIIKSKNNLGKGHALKIGVKKAKYDWILTTDIDMSVSLSITDDLSGTLDVDSSYSSAGYDYAYSDSYAVTATKIAKNQYDVEVDDETGLVLTCDVDTSNDTMDCAGQDSDGGSLEVSFALSE